jgi:hypothetical protein
VGLFYPDPSFDIFQSTQKLNSIVSSRFGIFHDEANPMLILRYPFFSDNESAGSVEAVSLGLNI